MVRPESRTTTILPSPRTRDGEAQLLRLDFLRLQLTVLLLTSCYPIEAIPNAKIPCIATSQPKNIIYLTCDAYGVLPPVSRLNSQQAQ